MNLHAEGICSEIANLNESDMKQREACQDRIRSHKKMLWIPLVGNLCVKS